MQNECSISTEIDDPLPQAVSKVIFDIKFNSHK